MAITLDDVKKMDAADPLAGRRKLFDLPEGVIYLNGNSLGALPHAVKARLRVVTENEWGTSLIAGWDKHAWLTLPMKVGDKIAHLIGAEPGEVVVTESTSVNLFRAIHNALQLKGGRGRILTEDTNFPTDLYVLDAIQRDSGGRVEVLRVPKGDIMAALGRDIDILTLTHANYKTSVRHDMAALNKKAKAVGALTVWDLSHSAGALPVDLNGSGADMAVGCGYKFLNGGPGGSGYIFVARRHQNKVLSAVAGWMGHVRPFDFSDHYEPKDGIGRQLAGTPFVLGAAALDAALDAFEGVDMEIVAEKAGKLGDLFITLVEEKCQGVGIGCPRDAKTRISQVTFCHPDAANLMRSLDAKGVVGDFRPPDVMRFGMTPLYTRYRDIWDAAEILASVLG